MGYHYPMTATTSAYATTPPTHRPACCTPGWSGSCGGTCDYASAEQERAEAMEARR